MVFVIGLFALNLAAAVMYGISRDWARVVFFTCAAILQLATLYMK